ncbi:hypothetical protein E2C01_008163 [Portunus trituberculatus]|uniref:Uncharacterized protein n=1 Tax=Portunus trituberculatus TaxID=210409 RepID=A0A5B7D574_PORTR|nr:hypothetical protein [Portunus trituberculatus]
MPATARLFFHGSGVAVTGGPFRIGGDGQWWRLGGGVLAANKIRHLVTHYSYTTTTKSRDTTTTTASVVVVFVSLLLSRICQIMVAATPVGSCPVPVSVGGRYSVACVVDKMVSVRSGRRPRVGSNPTKYGLETLPFVEWFKVTYMSP